MIWPGMAGVQAGSVASGGRHRYLRPVPDSLSPPPAADGMADFDFDLPERLIAQAPARPRDAARLLVVLEHHKKEKADRGEARVEIFLNRSEEAGVWHALVRNARRLRPGDTVAIEGAEGATARVLERQGDGGVMLDFGPDQAALAAALEQAGEVPLPPYIHRNHGPSDEDRQDYQTIFARRPGAVAAPTASLHFTPDLLAAIEARGVRRAVVTLHVGAGTFLPVRGDLSGHRLHAEWCELTSEAAATINATRRRGGRIVAIGTTAARLLETASTDDPHAPGRPFRGLTDIFVKPGYRFRAADVLMTNFHLPRSTLFMLACAFAGTARMRAAYAHAIASDYRFFSYGDATLLFPGSDTP